MWPTEIKKDCRRIVTALPYPLGVTILESVKGQLSDGIWENSPRMERYWKFFTIDSSPDGVITILISNAFSCYAYGYTRQIANAFKGMSASKVLKWFADKVKQIAKEEERYWPQDEFRLAEGNKGVSKCFGRGDAEITGHDAWLARKMLLGRAKDLA